MTLADYLATEQARKNLLIADVKTLPRASELHGQCFSVVIEHTEAWWRCRVMVGSESVTAYYRPDGDRYIVTDLGEGWRQHRIRTGRVDWTSAVIAACDYNPHIVDSGETATAGDCEKVILNAADLPDAICRVMLASLRVAGVGR